MRTPVLCILAFGSALVVGMSCADEGENDETSPDNAGEACVEADECYEGVDPAELRGEPLCLGEVEGGYCTHLCQTDADCCAVEGECVSDFPQVCAPFEATGMMMCFLTCEDVAEGESDAFCADEAHPAFICRSTGGGAANRRVCVPGG